MCISLVHVFSYDSSHVCISMAPSPSPPTALRRKFVAEPLETTVRSSRKSNFSNTLKTHDGDVSRNEKSIKNTVADASASIQTPPPTPPFLSSIEAFEALSRPSEKRPPESKSPLGSLPAHDRPPPDEDVKDVEQSANARRTRLPESIEISSQPSKKPLPKPIEMTSHSGNRKKTDSEREKSSSPNKNFLPQPVETFTRHRVSSKDRKPPKDSGPETPLQSTSRKFKPELIETARGSRRRAEVSPYLAHGKGLPTPARSHLSPQLTPAPPGNSPIGDIERVPKVHDSRFSAANLAKRQEKHHCYTVPELPSIESDSSEESQESLSAEASPPQSSAYNSMSGASASKEFDKKFSAYVLSLAARAAEKQLRDQAMAAYPNEMLHEPVDHFAMIDESRRPSIDMGRASIEGTIDLRKFRRESAADLELELEHMRRHHDKQERIKELQVADIGESRFSAAAIAAKFGNAPRQPSEHIGGRQSDVGIRSMRSAASPPMLGGSLVFPFSLSPKTTRCDPDQFPVPRTGEVEASDCEDSNRLWCATVNVHNTDDSGLWMGLCKGSNKSVAISGNRAEKSGIMTPNPELKGSPEDARATSIALGHRQLPPNPLASEVNVQTNDLDEKLRREKQIEDQFDEAFVTQIYNYLSLGFPSLARPFDHELSKISRISVAELRRDDLQSNAKGYIGAPEAPGEDETPGVERIRWTALKLYIREWFRQSSEMTENVPDDWGARVRRGSWAW